MHRPRYDDWSWPKGGVEPGEHALEAAAREACEETGRQVALGAGLGAATYSHDRGQTTVRWWAATARGEPVARDEEVDEVRWLPAGEALQLLTYRSDRAPLRRLLSWGATEQVVALVRHASAGSRRRWRGDDDDRPLDERGLASARRLGQVLPVFDPAAVVSAPLARCAQTVTPLAEATGHAVTTEPRLADRSWLRHPGRSVAAVTALASGDRTATGGGAVVACSQGEAIPGGGAVVACSQGEAIPGVVAALAKSSHRAGLLPKRLRDSDGAARSRKGSLWLLGFRGEELVTADYYPDLEPDR